MAAVLIAELPVAVVTGPLGGARVVAVVETAEGLLVDRLTGAAIDLSDLVAVYGLRELGSSAA